MVPSSIRQRLDVLLDSLADLRRYAGRYDLDRLGSDRDAQRMVLHALYTAWSTSGNFPSARGRARSAQREEGRGGGVPPHRRGLTKRWASAAGRSQAGFRTCSWQAAIDLALHMAADREQPGVSTYQEAFARLVDAGLIGAELARRLAGWAGLRNVLAHQYATLDLRRVDHALRNELGDLERLAEVAARWLDDGA